MHRIENNALFVSCDFCAQDWDGAAPVIEGHRGSIICLECLKIALDKLTAGEGTFKCELCLREPINASVRRWSHSNRLASYVCEGCIHQSAEVFDKDPDVPWKWERKAN